MRKFSEVLDEYLTEREKQTGDYYNNRYIGDEIADRYVMQDLANELDDIIHGVEE